MARAKGSGDPAKVFFDSHEMAHLRQLEILASKVFKGQLRGERETSRRGPGTSFREHRDYHAGDPLRLIDWNVLARMDLLVVKEFDAEVSLDVVLLQDCSESMRGAAARCAAKVTAALGAVAMPHMDRVLWAPVGGVGTRTADVFTGRGRLPDLFSAVDREPGGATDLMGALRGAVPRKSRGGVAFVMSDFFDPKGVGQALSYLVSRRFQVRVMLIEDPERLAPPPLGRTILKDAETGETTLLDITPDVVAAYNKAREARSESLAAFARRTGSGFLRVRADQPFFDIVRSAIRRGWLLP